MFLVEIFDPLIRLCTAGFLNPAVYGRFSTSFTDTTTGIYKLQYQGWQVCIQPGIRPRLVYTQAGLNGWLEPRQNGGRESVGKVITRGQTDHVDTLFYL